MSVTATLLIATYNRAALLRETLDSVARLRTPPDVTWDVVIVDNNSADGTREVVRTAAASFPVPLRYVFEPRQGKSIALNTALATISSAIILFSDDDVRVPEKWLMQAIQPLVDRPDISYVGGPVRPRWTAAPPKWLKNSTRAAGVLALLDYGSERFVFEDRRLIPLGVNMAVRRDVIDRVGGFHAALGRRGNSLLGQEQAEFFLRSRRMGARGLYVPEMSLEHVVPVERLSLKYFSRWWFWKGVSHARWYRMHKETELGVDLSHSPRLLGIPLFTYRTAAVDAGAAGTALLRARPFEALDRLLMLTYFFGYARESWFGGRTLPAQVGLAPAAEMHTRGTAGLSTGKTRASAPDARRHPARRGSHSAWMRKQLKGIVDAALAGRGLRLLSNWRLDKWDQSCHTRDLLQYLNIDCVLDVGGNIGQYQEFLRLHVGYHEHIVSFEPIGELYERLCRAKVHDPKWSVHRLALGEEDTALPLNVMRERTLSSFLNRNERQLQQSGYEKYLRETEVVTTEDVPVRRLDRIVDDVLPPGASRLFLKTDTQGYDMSVIAGASGCMDRILALQIELSVRHVYVGAPDYLDALRALQSMGYELTALFPVQRDSAMRVVNLDCLMVRRDEAERLRAITPHPGGN